MSELDISVIFPSIPLLFYPHSNLEGSCSNGTKTRHVNVAVACKP